MKRIIYVRHAKTEPWDYGMQDFDRQLTKRGINDSQIMADSLKLEGLIPDRIYSSSAVRAKQTAELLVTNLDLKNDVLSLNPDLYEYVSTQDIQNLLSTTDNAVETIMIVGHNPWISNVAAMLSKNFHSILPTTGIVCLEYKTSKWEEIFPGKGKLAYYKTPKSFK